MAKNIAKSGRRNKKRAAFPKKSDSGRHLVDMQKMVIFQFLESQGFPGVSGRHLVDMGHAGQQKRARCVLISSKCIFMSHILPLPSICRSGVPTARHTKPAGRRSAAGIRGGMCYGKQLHHKLSAQPVGGRGQGAAGRSSTRTTRRSIRPLAQEKAERMAADQASRRPGGSCGRSGGAGRPPGALSVHGQFLKSGRDFIHYTGGSGFWTMEVRPHSGRPGAAQAGRAIPCISTTAPPTSQLKSITIPLHIQMFPMWNGGQTVYGFSWTGSAPVFFFPTLTYQDITQFTLQLYDLGTEKFLQGTQVVFLGEP